MTDERFDADLRAVLEELAPSSVPPELRLAVLDVPHCMQQPGHQLRAPAFGLAGLAVVAAVALLVVLLRPFPAGPTAGALPSPHSALVSGFIEQVDGAYGYRVLRPANWTTTGGDGTSRDYLSPGYSVPPGHGLADGQGVAIGVTNVQRVGEAVARTGSMVYWQLFQQAPTLAGWTGRVEQWWQANGVGARLLRTLPNARLYLMVSAGGQPMPGLQITAYAVVDGQPLTVTLAGAGSYADLATLERDGIIDDFATMTASVAPVPADPSHVSPPLPAPATPPWGAPAPSPTMVENGSPTIPASSASPTLPAQTPTPSDVAAAKAAVAAYTGDLIAGRYAAAWAMLGPEVQAHFGSLASFTSLERAFFQSAGSRFTVIAPDTRSGPITDWLPTTYGAHIDLAHAVLVEVDYAALAGNNAGYTLFIVNPTPNGPALYDVR